MRITRQVKSKKYLRKKFKNDALRLRATPREALLRNIGLPFWPNIFLHYFLIQRRTFLSEWCQGFLRVWIFTALVHCYNFFFEKSLFIKYRKTTKLHGRPMSIIIICSINLTTKINFFQIHTVKKVRLLENEKRHDKMTL